METEVGWDEAVIFVDGPHSLGKLIEWKLFLLASRSLRVGM